MDSVRAPATSARRSLTARKALRSCILPEILPSPVLLSPALRPAARVPDFARRLTRRWSRVTQARLLRGERFDFGGPAGPDPQPPAAAVDRSSHVSGLWSRSRGGGVPERSDRFLSNRKLPQQRATRRVA